MGVVAGIAGSAVIVLALYALIDAIVLLFFNGSLYIAEAIMTRVSRPFRLTRILFQYSYPNSRFRTSAVCP